MADTIQSDIFKFVALRPPMTIEQQNKLRNYISDDREAEETPPGNIVVQFREEGSPQILDSINELINREGYSLDFPEEGSINRISEYVQNLDQRDISSQRLKDDIEQLLDRSVESFYTRNENINQRHDIWNMYYSFYMLGRREPQNLEILTRNLRIYHLLDMLRRDIDIPNATILNNILTAKPLVPKLFSDLPKPTSPANEPEGEADEQTASYYQNLWKNLVDTQRAMEEVKNIRFENKISSEVKAVEIPNRITGRADKTNLTMVTNRLVVNQQSFQSLHSETKRLLSQSQMTEDNLQLSDALSQLEAKQQKAVFTLSNINDSNLMKFKPEDTFYSAGFNSIIADLESKFGIGISKNQPTNVRASIKPLGIGDLKVVKQKLLKYVAGEVAHIENVLKGESKERRHRVLDRTEEISVQTKDTEEEITKDTQTTERFELKKESEKAMQEQMSVQAGVTVSGSYGMVTFGAHGDFAYSTASSESNKNSSNFAREVIDKSLSRIQKKIKEERTSKRLHEVEEINIHGFNNAKDGSDNIAGIYRWVDKHYEAQIFNYGKRMMFEFIIPEPAAFYEFALNNPPKKEIQAPPPFNLTHRAITWENYAQYVAAYNVQGVLPPPLPFKTISTALVKEGMELDGKAHTMTTKELVVPAGYISKAGVWFDCSAYFNNCPRLEITIGNKIFRLLDNPAAVGAAANNANSPDPYHWFWEGSPIEISINSYDIISYTVNAYILVELTNEARELWQLQTFEKIMSAYKAMQAEYEQKIAAQKTQAGVVISGHNPGINREIEKTELKKHCIKLLMDTYQFGYFDAMKQQANQAPDFDIFDAMGEGKTIQFFEQCFEWENLTYLFYPYFWGRSTEWIKKVNTYDVDPLFTKFRQAGSSRVVLPVHPGYNDAIMYFLENNGTIWNGGETPRLNDPLFISLADELKAQTDDLAGAKPEGDPWEVVLPTTLVYLQQDSVLPDFT